MSYIGSTPTSQNFIAGTDYFNGTGSQTAFTLSRTVSSVNDIQATVNNVVQVPNDAYTISGTTITFTSAPSAGTSNIYVRYLSTTTQSITPSQGTVSNTSFGNVTAIPFVAGPSLGAGNASIMKNRIINGAMVISQRYGTSAVSDAANIYTLDRWTSIASLGSKFSVQQNAGSVTPPTGFTNYLGVTSSSAYAVTAGQAFVLQQAIEGFNTADLGWGTANAKTVTLSFQVYSSLTGTFGGVITNSAQNRSYPFTYSIPTANTWTSASVTITGDTSGTWIGATNGIGMSVFFGLGVGSSLSGTAGAWAGATYYSATGATSLVGTSGATLFLTGVQLEVGSSATGFEYVNYQTSLANCQRYFWRKSGVASAVVTVGSGMAYNTTDIRCTLPNPVTMRSTPTVSFTGSNYEYEKTASSRGTLGSVDATARSVDASTLFSGSGTTATTAGQGAIWYITDSASYISISAEL